MQPIYRSRLPSPERHGKLGCELWLYILIYSRRHYIYFTSRCTSYQSWSSALIIADQRSLLIISADGQLISVDDPISAALMMLSALISGHQCWWSALTISADYQRWSALMVSADGQRWWPLMHRWADRRTDGLWALISADGSGLTITADHQRWPLISADDRWSSALIAYIDM